MSLDPTAREANVLDSLKKYFVDNLFTISKIPLGFDQTLSQPKIQGSPSEISKWVNINFGEIDITTMSTFFFEMYLCSRKDNEGFVLAQLRDTVSELLTDTDGTYGDGMKRIPFYKSVEGGFDNWTLLGQFLVQDVSESGRFFGPDNTKYRVITPRLRFASKG